MQLFAGYQGIKNNMQFEFLTDNCHPKHVLHHPRTTFLILVATALGGCWALEHPGGSCFQYFPPFADLCQRLYEAFGGTAALSLLETN